MEYMCTRHNPDYNVILIPPHFTPTGDGRGRQDEPNGGLHAGNPDECDLTYSNIDMLSMSNMPTGSLGFWTHLIMAYAFSIRTCYSPEKGYANVARMRLHFLASESRRPDQFTVSLMWLNEKRRDSKRLFDSGGMPSSHAATVTALAMGISLREGTERSEFTIAIVLAGVVMYDASGIRFHSGRQAELLNQIVCEFPSDHPLASVRPLRELLGHTPVQVVAGAALGSIVAYLMRNSD